MEIARCTTKTILLALAALFAVLAAFVWIVSITTIVNFHHYDEFTQSRYILVPALVLIAVGFFFFFAAILGCCAGCRENQCVLMTFGLLLMCLTALLAASAVLAYSNKAAIEDSIRNDSRAAIDRYTGKNGTVVDDEINLIQRQLKCCGSLNYMDWFETDWEAKQNGTEVVPWSCCVNDTACHGGVIDTKETPELINDRGCYSMIEERLVTNVKWIGVAAIVLVALMVLGFISTCVLAYLIRTQNLPYFNLDA